MEGQREAMRGYGMTNSFASTWKEISGVGNKHLSPIPQIYFSLNLLHSNNNPCLALRGGDAQAIRTISFLLP